jgi:hypothetical protein
MGYDRTSLANVSQWNDLQNNLLDPAGLPRPGSVLVDTENNPHDALFRLVFSDPERVIDELKSVLPPELFAMLDVGSLALLKTHTTTFELPDYISDLMYEVRLAGTEIKIWFIHEHQSTAPVLLPLRFAQYTVAAWTALVGDVHKPRVTRLPFILPIVLVHDPQGRRSPLKLSDLYDVPEAFLRLTDGVGLQLQYYCDDLNAVTPEAIAQRSDSPVYRLTLWLLKSRGRPGPEYADAFKAAFRELRAAGYRSLISGILQYIVRTSGDEESVPLRAAKAADPIFEEDIVTLTETWFKEGEAKGRVEGEAKGRLEGRADLLLQQLHDRFGTVSTDIAQRVQDGSAEDHSRWARRILRADSLTAVFDDA